jgi:hypothetical protein
MSLVGSVALVLLLGMVVRQGHVLTRLTSAVAGRLAALMDGLWPPPPTSHGRSANGTAPHRPDAAGVLDGVHGDAAKRR